MLSDRLPNAANVVEFLKIELREIMGLSVCFLTHDHPLVRKSVKFGSRDRIYFNLFSQASIEVIVSFKESDHCFGALVDVITTVHEFPLGCSERRLKSNNTLTSLSLRILWKCCAATTPVS